jgi:hypothetical protein
VSLAPLERGKDHRFEMATQFVAVDRFHPFIIDRLGIAVNGEGGPVARERPSAVKTALLDSVGSTDALRGDLRGSMLFYTLVTLEL